MLVQVGGLQIQNLQKADSGLVTVDIVANHLTEDEDGETVLREAFNEDTVKEFLDIGVLEFWHETKNPLLTKEEKNKNILGKPIGFRWDNGLPVVRAQLTAKHPIVQDMLPHLEAGNPVYAASIGGSKVVLEVAGPDGKKHRVIPKIKWDHLAIAPAHMVVNREGGVNVRLLQKAKDIYVEFGSVQEFSRSGSHIFGQEQELVKALLAPGSVSDLQNTPGGVLTKQSLEKTVTPLIFNEDESIMLIDTIMAYRKGDMPTTRKDYMSAFPKNAEFADKSYRLFEKYFSKI